jgi:hypothetical protein
MYARTNRAPKSTVVLRERQNLELQVSDRWRHFVSDFGAKKKIAPRLQLDVS